MTTHYRFSCLPCGACAGKNHCETCQGQIEALLRRHPGVLDARANRRENALTITHEGIDPEALEEALDAAGVFVS